MQKPIIIFDWEVFPEWNCMVYNEYNGTDDIELKVITSDDADYISKLKTVAKLGYVVGFNIKGYDLQIWNFAMDGWLPHELYEYSEDIINSTDSGWKSLNFWRNFEFSDLYDDMKGMGSLKQFESNTGLSIRESTVPFGKTNLTEAEKQEIIEYCKADVRATNRLCKARWGYLTAKANCSKLSALSEADCLKNTAPKVCAKMLGAKQQPNDGMIVYEIPDKLKDLFRENLHPILLSNFEGQVLRNDFSYEVNYLKNHFVYGTGGVHSTHVDSCYFISNDEYALVNADFENLYPGLVTEYDYYAEGIPPEGKELFKYLLSECRRLKKVLREMAHDGKRDTQEYKDLFGIRDSIKLVMNAATGAYRNRYSPVYDPPRIISLCMTGQLLTTCVAKLIHNMGGLIIQTNTDGIAFRIRKTELKAVEQMLAEVSEKIGIPLEVEEEYAIFQKDVNNYILLSSPDAKPKLKGRWAKKSGSDVPLVPLNAPVINTAVINYYTKNIPIEETITNCTNPLDFMMTTMKGPTYAMVTYGDEPTTNINRVYASCRQDAPTLYKLKLDEEGEVVRRDKIASIPDALEGEFKLQNIDYSWYIKQAKTNLIAMKELN